MSAENNAKDIAVLATKLDILVEKVEKIETQMDKMEAQVNHWKGAFFIVLIAGGLIGWLVDKALTLWMKLTG